MPNSAVETQSLLYRDNLIVEFARLRAMYEPRPTPWSGQSPDEQAVTTNQWVDIMTAAGMAIRDLRDAIGVWSSSEGGEWFPAPMDLLRLAARAKKTDSARRPAPGSNVHCDGSGWVTTSDGRMPCPRCSPELAEVYADPARFALWRKGTNLSEVGVGVELRRGLLRSLLPSDERAVCRRAYEPPIDAERGLAAARSAYVDECTGQGRGPSWDHFDTVLARAAARPPEAPVDESPNPDGWW